MRIGINFTQEYLDLLEAEADLNRMSVRESKEGEPSLVLKVTCDDLEQMDDLFNELKGRGIRVKAS
jgi:putative lipoic acid-binding regulatory protein